MQTPPPPAAPARAADIALFPVRVPRSNRTGPGFAQKKLTLSLPVFAAGSCAHFTLRKAAGRTLCGSPPLHNHFQLPGVCLKATTSSRCRGSVHNAKASLGPTAEVKNPCLSRDLLKPVLAPGVQKAHGEFQ